MILILFYLINGVLVIFNLFILVVSLVVYDHIHGVLGLRPGNLLLLISISLLGVVVPILGMSKSKTKNVLYVCGTILFMNGMLILLIKIDDFSQFINKWVEIKYRILSKVNQNYVRSILGCCDDAKECEVGCFNRIGQLFRRTVQIIHKVIIGLFILDSISLALYVNK